MQVKLVCNALVALARSRPTAFPGNHTVRRSRMSPRESFLRVGGRSKASVQRALTAFDVSFFIRARYAYPRHDFARMRSGFGLD
jgi:hypothetical protein